MATPKIAPAFLEIKPFLTASGIDEQLRKMAAILTEAADAFQALGETRDEAPPADRVIATMHLGDEDQADEERRQADAKASAGLDAYEFQTAVDHLRAVVPQSKCSYVEGRVLDSGVRTCMAHHRPVGTVSGKCPVEDAQDFLAEHAD